MPLIFNETRLAIFKAAQQGDLDELNRLLDQDPELLHAKTTTSGSTLLHIAAERGHEQLCQHLLDRGHETNPLDIKGLTPYQRTEKESIKRLLAEKHGAYLFEHHFSASEIPHPNFPHIKSISLEYKVLSLVDFFAFSKSRGMKFPDCCSKFSLTGISHKINPSSSERLDYKARVYLREDLLMSPYFGVLMVIHANESVTQYMELLGQGIVDIIQVINRGNIQIETRNYITNIARGLELFPFLQELPVESDSNTIKEAKKLFIGFTLLDFGNYYHQCNMGQIDRLRSLAQYEPVTDFAEIMISLANKSLWSGFSEEMKQKYVKAYHAIAEAAGNAAPEPAASHYLDINLI